MSEGFIGEIRMFAGNFAPKGWAFCNGQIMSISSNQALFSILSTTYGGDGRTSFALPDLRGRVAIGTGEGAGLSGKVLGQRGGVEYVKLSAHEMPTHTHAATTSCNIDISATGTIKCTNGGVDTNNPEGNNISQSKSTTKVYSDGESNKRMKEGNVDINIDQTNFNLSTQITEAGGNNPHTNMQPYSCINYIICIDGLYPPKN
ncbi:tail fiber protein [Clostridiaceae bacterium M8S5]|nr:tail fiber protein [Clostridiaceae bacterium M8S5]